MKHQEPKGHWACGEPQNGSRPFVPLQSNLQRVPERETSFAGGFLVVLRVQPLRLEAGAGQQLVGLAEFPQHTFHLRCEYL